MSDIYHAKTGKLIAKLKERIASLETENERLRGVIKEGAGRVLMMQAENAHLREGLRELLEGLKQAAWASPNPTTLKTCSACGGYFPKHGAKCKRAALIAKAEKLLEGK